MKARFRRLFLQWRKRRQDCGAAPAPPLRVRPAAAEEQDEGHGQLQAEPPLPAPTLAVGLLPRPRPLRRHQEGLCLRAVARRNPQHIRAGELRLLAIPSGVPAARTPGLRPEDGQSRHTVLLVPVGKFQVSGEVGS